MSPILPKNDIIGDIFVMYLAKLADI